MCSHEGDARGTCKHDETIALPNACTMGRLDGQLLLHRRVLICTRDVQIDNQIFLLSTVMVWLHSPPCNLTISNDYLILVMHSRQEQLQWLLGLLASSHRLTASMPSMQAHTAACTPVQGKVSVAQPAGSLANSFVQVTRALAQKLLAPWAAWSKLAAKQRAPDRTLTGQADGHVLLRGVCRRISTRYDRCAL